ncbi:PREDICTED: (+)-neomenthol dehydrogenase-like [Fragaria vesca subsp. vesca]|uniref:(+)-neomenthol dehydrogenase-like n=1 Tax=Fragaria vesca subsp. vesca TaxID=101020 RepID=UPI0002C36E25|nr:PREDICTED: (+)-neomenthol dehydrogenase-like [Fragaria vesca subsp. vesca]
MQFKETDRLLIPSPSHSSTRWWSEETVAIVTGANKGIGFAVVKRMAELGLKVILTARDSERGCKAVEALRAQGLHSITFYRLDVSDPCSINTFASWFKENFTALDILVNNAAVSFNEINENSVEHAETVIRTNFNGPKLLTEALLPMFRTSSMSRILNVSSRLGSLNKVGNPSIKQVLESEKLSEDDIEGIVSLFLEQVKTGTWKTGGWPELWTDYAVSKLALNAYTRVLAKRYEGRALSVNSFCPGFTQTSMTGCKGDHTADEVAILAARLALLPPDNIQSGKFFLWGISSGSSTSNNTLVVSSKL